MSEQRWPILGLTECPCNGDIDLGSMRLPSFLSTAKVRWRSSADLPIAYEMLLAGVNRRMRCGSIMAMAPAKRSGPTSRTALTMRSAR